MTGDKDVGLVQWSEGNGCTVEKKGGRKVIGVSEMVWEGAALELGQKEDGLRVDRPLYGPALVRIFLMLMLKAEGNLTYRDAFRTSIPNVGPSFTFTAL